MEMWEGRSPPKSHPLITQPSEVTTNFIQLLDAGNFQAITSELTLAEVLVKPLIDNNVKVRSAYENAIQSSQVLEVVPINRTILRESARLRSMINIRLPDAIHSVI